MEMRCFSPPERWSRLSNHGIIAVRQGRDEIVAAGGLGSGHHLFMGASGQPNLMLFSTVSWNRYTVWNTMEMFLSKLSQVNSRTSCPPTETEPAFTS